jgi:hypothetical protein
MIRTDVSCAVIQTAPYLCVTIYQERTYPDLCQYAYNSIHISCCSLIQIYVNFLQQSSLTFFNESEIEFTAFCL